VSLFKNLLAKVGLLISRVLLSLNIFKKNSSSRGCGKCGKDPQSFSRNGLGVFLACGKPVEKNEGFPQALQSLASC
jgi:hypothetical protein